LHAMPGAVEQDLNRIRELMAQLRRSTNGR